VFEIAESAQNIRPIICNKDSTADFMVHFMKKLLIMVSITGISILPLWSQTAEKTTVGASHPPFLKVSSEVGKPVSSGCDLQIPDSPGRLQSVKPLKADSSEDTTDNDVEIIGCVVYSGNTASRAIGLYTFTPDGKFTQRVKGLNASGGGVLTPETYYSVMYSIPAPTVYQVTILKIDPLTWRRSSGGRSDLIGLAATDMAYDITTDNIYGCFWNADASGFIFGRADYSSNIPTKICDLEKPYVAVMADSKGQIYGIDSYGVLFKINKKTGAAAKVGATGVAPGYFTSATIDSKTGKCWFTVSLESRKSALYTVDLTTGLATKVRDFEFNEQINGLAVNRPWSVPKAPAAVSELKADFASGSLSGSVSFKMPETTSDGGELSGNINYTVLVNGEEKVSGYAACGEVVTVPMTLSEDGNSKFAVVLSNGYGYSVPARTSMVVGIGTPTRPAPSLTYSDGAFTISWKAVSSTVAGGYFKASDVRYNVVRYPDNKIVAVDTDALCIVDSVATTPDLRKYYYGVTAGFRNKISAEGLTSAYVLGSEVYPEWSDNFDNNDIFKLFTVIDANSDGKTWKRVSSTSGGAGCAGDKLAMDDWLISPPLRLKGGNVYKITMVTGSAYPAKAVERIEMKFGDSPTVEGMKLTLIDRTELNHADNRPYSAYARIDADGLYYFGLHGCSDAESFRLDVEEVSIGGAVSLKSPGYIDNLKFVPDPNGDPKGTLYIKTPAKTVDGSDLKTLTSVEVKRDGKLVKTINVTSPGATVICEDAVDQAGNYKYSVVACNENGPGLEYEASMFMGINIPAQPEKVVAEETSRPGEVKVSWTPVRKDKDGNSMDPSLITYKVVRLMSSGNIVVAQHLTDTTFTYNAIKDPDNQEFVSYGVFAVSKGGESEGKGSGIICIGVPYNTPWRESFSNAAVSYNMGIRRIFGDAQWKLAGEKTFTGVGPQDNDGGFVAMQGQNVLDSAMLYSGRIDLSKAVRPALTFYTFNIIDPQDKTKIDPNTLDIMVDDGSGWKRVKYLAVHESSSDGSDGWKRIVVDLDDYKGKIIQFGISACIKLYAFVMIDNIRVGNLPDENLSVISLSSSKRAAPDKPFVLTAVVENCGRKESSESEVRLMRNGKLRAVLTLDALKPGEKRNVQFTDSLRVVDDEINRYSASVEYSSDQDHSDNVSPEMVVEIEFPYFPRPMNLTGEQISDGNVRLFWTAPDASGTSTVTETFESYPSYSNSGLGEWTLIDADQGIIGGISGVPIPGIEMGSRQSWWVMDANIRPENPTFRAHGGEKYLWQMVTYDENGNAVRCDDWAVSPRLSGAAQTISLYARSYNGKYPETFKIMYTTGDKDEIAGYKEAEVYTDVPTEWTEYRVDLPHGAKYFAIRAVSFDCMSVNIDDVTYQPAAGDDLDLLGYNIYRDGKLLNEKPVPAVEYTDEKVTEGKHSYQVTALFSKGESRPSDKLSLNISSVEKVSGGIEIIACREGIVIRGAGGMHTFISDASGRSIYSSVAPEMLVLDVASGVYVVKIGNIVKKLIVR